MAVKIRVKQGGDDQDKPKPKQDEPKGKVKVKVKATTVPEIQKDPNIKGPIGYLNSYYASPLFAQRYKDLNKEEYDNAGTLSAQRNYKAQKGVYPDVGSHSRSIGEMRGWDNNSKPQSPTVFLDTVQAKKYKTNLENDVVPHEYSHSSRGLTILEEKDMVNRNKAQNVAKKYPVDKFIKSDDYKEEVKYGNTENLYSEHLASKSPDSHDEQPNENYADLNSVRYMMYKQGIYDTRKGPMTIDHIKKAMQDPWLQKQFGFKRMLKNFKPEDIVKLNNTIAANKKKQNQNTA